MTTLLAIRQVGYALRLTSRRSTALFVAQSNRATDLPGSSLDRHRPHVTPDVRSAQSNQFDFGRRLQGSKLCPRADRPLDGRSEVVDTTRRQLRRRHLALLVCSRCRRLIMILFRTGGGQAAAGWPAGRTDGRLIMPPPRWENSLPHVVATRRHVREKTGNSFRRLTAERRRCAVVAAGDDGN